MTQFTVNPQRFDPYKNFQFRVKWDGRYIAGVSRISALRRTTEVSRISALRRTTEVIEHREGGDPSTSRKSPGTTKYEAITLERGVTLSSNNGQIRFGRLEPDSAPRRRSKIFAKTLLSNFSMKRGNS
jgi:phage tail-like protein